MTTSTSVVGVSICLTRRVNKEFTFCSKGYSKVMYTITVAIRKKKWSGRKRPALVTRTLSGYKQEYQLNVSARVKQKKKARLTRQAAILGLERSHRYF